MLFVGWLLVGAGVTLMYSAVTNQSVTCLVKATLSGSEANCTNGSANFTGPASTPGSSGQSGLDGSGASGSGSSGGGGGSW